MTLFSSDGLRVCARRILSACQVLGQHRVPEFFDQTGMCRFVDEIMQLAGIIGQIEQFDERVRVKDVGGWQIAVFGKNLLNKVYAYQFDPRSGTNFGAPRSFGISVQREF